MINQYVKHTNILYFEKYYRAKITAEKQAAQIMDGLFHLEAYDSDSNDEQSAIKKWILDTLLLESKVHLQESQHDK